MPKRNVKYMQRQREQILNAALKCFAKKGFHETSIDDIAGRCRLSSGGLYVHFKSKLEIYDALEERSFRQFNARPSACNTFEELVDQLLETLDAPNSLDATLFGLRLFAEVHGSASLRRRYRGLYDRILAFYCATSRADPLTRDLPVPAQEALARQLWLAMTGYTLLRTTVPDVDLQVIAADLRDATARIIHGAIEEASRVHSGRNSRSQ